MAKTLSGSLIGKALNAYGKKPKVPELPKIDPTMIQQEAIAGNQQNLPALEALGAQVNRINAQQARALLDLSLPGQLGQAEQVVGSQLRGEIPADVASLVTRQAAATSLGLGVGGSGVQSNITARDLGLTSLRIQQQGLQNFGALANIVRPPQFDVSSMFFTPAQRLSFAVEDRSQRFQRDLLAAQVKAAPDPADVAVAEGIDNFMAFWAGVGGAALGNIGGGGALTTQGNPGVSSGINTSAKGGGGFMGGII